MSALPSKADVPRQSLNVRLVPIADILPVAFNIRLLSKSRLQVQQAPVGHDRRKEKGLTRSSRKVSKRRLAKFGWISFFAFGGGNN
jgi:hypothetical protein